MSLYNKKSNGILDQDEYGYLRDYYADESYKKNEYVRWVFIKKEDHFLVYNPKSGKYLFNGNTYHAIKVSDIDKNIQIKWDLEFFRSSNENEKKLYVKFKAVNSESDSKTVHFSSKDFEKNRLGYSHCQGFHLEANNTIEEYVLWELLQLDIEIEGYEKDGDGLKSLNLVKA